MQVTTIPKVSTPDFPCLMQAKESALVVLFANGNTGAVVRASPRYLLGYHASDWAICTFVPFTETLQLSND